MTTRANTMKIIRRVRKAVAWLVSITIVVTPLGAYAQTPTESITHYHNDIAGSPLAATDAAGNLLWQESYRPYGERIQNSPASTGNKLWFHGKQVDDDSGLSYFGARSYDPVLGRFMGIDLVRFNEHSLQSFSRYAYANNNPYKYKDPDGLAPSPVDAFFTSFSAGEFLAIGILNIYGRLTDDRGLTEVTSAAMLPAAGALAQDAAGLVNPAPGASGARRAAQAAEKNADLLFRRGPHDSRKLLETQASAAEKQLGIHGVSASTSAKAKPGQVVRCASRAACEAAGFKVHKTGSDPDHYTVELPKPVTKEDAKKFNDLFR